MSDPKKPWREFWIGTATDDKPTWVKDKRPKGPRGAVCTGPDIHVIEHSAVEALEDGLKAAYAVSKAYADKIKALEAKLKVATAALEFYSDPNTYCLFEDLSVDEWEDNWIAERTDPQRITEVGKKAKSALAKISDTNGGEE